jgi:hypothetical protein
MKFKNVSVWLVFVCWIKIDQLDVTRFIISLFTAQYVSNVGTFIFRSLRLIADLSHGLYCSGLMCVGVTVWFSWGGVVYPDAGWSNMVFGCLFFYYLNQSSLNSLGKYKLLNTTCQSITQHFILYTIKIVYCPGDMFWPLLGHLQALWENWSKS